MCSQLAIPIRRSGFREPPAEHLTVSADVRPRTRAARHPVAEPAFDASHPGLRLSDDCLQARRLPSETVVAGHANRWAARVSTAIPALATASAVQAVVYNGFDQEAVFVADAIVAMRQQRPEMKFSDIAVLYRTHTNREKVLAELRRRDSRARAGRRPFRHAAGARRHGGATGHGCLQSYCSGAGRRVSPVQWIRRSFAQPLRSGARKLRLSHFWTTLRADSR